MAILSPENRRRVWAQLMRSWPKSLGRIPVDKVILRDVIDKTDDWAEANQASFNAALPVAFRTSATPEMKAHVLSFVIERRANRLATREDVN